MAVGRWRVVGKRVAKAVLGLLVVAAAARQIVLTVRGLSARGERLEFDPAWLSASVVLYVVGLVPFALFYTHLLRHGPSPIRALPAVRAYFVSHLGKYVPGKALVVVMRAALSTPFGARPAAAAFATLYETLVMMAAGGFVAMVGFSQAPARWVRLDVIPDRPIEVPLLVLGLGAAAGFTTLVVGRVFRAISRLISLPFPGVGPEALPRTEARDLGLGLGLATLGWILLGLSQVAVIRGLGLAALPAAAVSAVVASVALATVAGFAVPISPGGLGVREWVLWTSLGTFLDRDRAVVAALGLRLAWVVGEVIATAVLLPCRMLSQRPGAPT